MVMKICFLFFYKYDTLCSMKVLIHWIILTLTVIVLTQTIPGISIIDTGQQGGLVMTAFVVAAVIGFTNLIIKPIISLVTLPINILTLGLFSVVVNALLFSAVARVVQNFSVADFKAALLGSLVIAVVNSIVNKID